MVDGATGGMAHRKAPRRADESTVFERLAHSPRDHTADAPAPAAGTQRTVDQGVDAPPMATHQKKIRDLHGTLVFTDESGFLLLPLIRRTLARIGETPLLRHRASHRDKVSSAAALTLSPVCGRIRLFYQTLVNDHFDAELYGYFLRRLLHEVRGQVVLVHDRGNIHRGPIIRELQREFGRLHVHEFPPYAPELNPVEYLWNWCKDKRLCNFVPHDIVELEAAACECLDEVRHDQYRLRSFFYSSPLSWSGTGLI
jgi:transposase